MLLFTTFGKFETGLGRKSNFLLNSDNVQYPFGNTVIVLILTKDPFIFLRIPKYLF